MKKSTVRVYDTISKNMLTLKSMRKFVHITTGHNGIWMTMMNHFTSMKFSFQR